MLLAPYRLWTWVLIVGLSCQHSHYHHLVPQGLWQMQSCAFWVLSWGLVSPDHPHLLQPLKGLVSHQPSS